MLAGTALRLEVTIEAQAGTGSLPRGPHWTVRTVSSNILSEGCLPGRQPPAEAENSPKDFQSNAKMIDLDALVAGLELG